MEGGGSRSQTGSQLLGTVGVGRGGRPGHCTFAPVGSTPRPLLGVELVRGYPSLV